MADVQHDLDIETTDETDHPEHRSFLGVAAAVIVIVVVVLVLMMIRGCDTGKAAARGRDGDRSITSVEGLSPEKGAVSLWLNQGINANAAIASAGVRSTDVLNVGGGRYVIAVPEGSEADCVTRLEKTVGVIDAGLVYAGREAE